MKQNFFLGKSLDSLVKGKKTCEGLGKYLYIHTSILSLKKIPDPSDSC